MSPREALHCRAVQHVARRLRSRGHTVVIYARHADKWACRRTPQVEGDLFVPSAACGRHWVAVRVARPHTSRHVTTINGREYVYHYREVLWNLAHGHSLHEPDVWALVRWDTAEVYLVPAEELRGRLTVQVQAQLRGKPRHVLAPWLRRWDMIKAPREWRAA